jgi:uncharacterized protein YcsI (UPF0317 family)
MNHQLAQAGAAEVRQACRAGQLAAPTSGLALGFVQANLVILPKKYAFDFLLFCVRNPRPCPLLEVTEPGCWEPRHSAPGADLRVDLPRYAVYRSGKLAEQPTDIKALWKDDFVAFLLGCSFTFEKALLQAGLPLRHLEEGKTVPMYRTNRPCQEAGIFHGNLVASMRPLTPAQAIQATLICQRFPHAHGPPIWWGDPAGLGIEDLAQPDYGDAVTIHPGEAPVFWACGVTPQNVLRQARPTLAITHAPGHMFVTDLRDEDGAG